MFYNVLLSWVIVSQLFRLVVLARDNLTTVVPHALMSRLDGKNFTHVAYVRTANIIHD